MIFKNFSTKQKRVETILGHVVLFQPEEERDIPLALQQPCLEAGLVPMDGVKETLETASIKEAEEAIVIEQKAQEEEALAAQEAAKALEKATASARTKAQRTSATAKKATAKKAAAKAKAKSTKLKKPSQE